VLKKKAPEAPNTSASCSGELLDVPTVHSADENENTQKYIFVVVLP
jgi:hypothetical protein